MKKKLTMLLASLFLVLGTAWAQAPVDSPEQAITGLLNRIGGDGAANLFEIVIDANLAENGKDVFVITSQNSKPCIKGNTQLSVATGINWYLNHYAHINLTWNNLTTDLSKVTLPVPGGEEKHVCNAPYRYDFNTCTFSYSMAFWTWERWQQEIDWMALHGINAPLNLVGLDVVTRKFLRELGVSENDINAYIAGPGFIAWFAMNNLEGWGGTINATDVTMNGNPDWWYTRQEKLCRDMLRRMRELGMQPVIPGFSGQVPNCIVNYSINDFSSGDVVDNGTWAGGYTRPDILKPNTTSYQTFATVYYKHLHEVMGVSELYSIDPFHEGSLPGGVTNETCYPNIMVELDKHFGNVEQSVKDTYKVTKSPSWIIQYWQGVPQSGAFTAMKNAGYTNRFIGLDLFADNIYADNAAKWRTNYYDTCPYIYCMLHNFGGRSGLHGRLETTMDGYFQALAKGNNCQGIGATPEGTETNPILYDMLFELPWMDVNNRPTADEWLEDYAYARYGVQNEKALEALKNLKKSVWDCKVNQQGTSEAVILARPNWTINSVSSWSTSAIYWDIQDVLQAADKLYSIKEAVTANGGQDGIANYNYDFIDVVRQAMVDYAAQLLPLINAARNDDAEYTRLYQLYLQLMLDLDEMLSYDENFKLERWTSLARNIANEVSGTTENDRNWLEWNARTQVTVWSKGNTDLHDYSNRCWAGLIKDFHYKRWEKFFTTKGGSFDGGWFSGFEYPWTVDFTNYNYSTVTIPTDMTATEKAAETFGEYFGRVKGATKNYIFPMGVATKATKSDVVPEVYRGQTVALPLEIGKNVTIASVWVDFNNDGAKGNGETFTAPTTSQVAIPADAKIGKTTAQVVYSDGTDITFNLALVEDINDNRTVTAVAGANGSVAIEGTDKLSITNTEAVKMTATANTGYNFENWTDADGNVVSNDNPYIYYGKEAATFTANFIQDKWGVPTEDKSDWGDATVKTSFVNELTFAYYNREPETIYEASVAPDNLFNTLPQIINVPQGASFDVTWSDNGDNGLKFCCLSAYIDLNADGDFTDEGELLKVAGTKGAQSTTACEGKINVLLPYDAPLGLTHMRIRFDGAWKDNGYNATTKSYDAKAQLNRMCYEVVINVTEKSDKAATINVETNNAAWGTVEVWTDETPDGSTGTEWSVSANIPMYLRATKASEDVEFLGWYDQYGRLLTSELEYSMLAREDATYTARFRRFLEIDGWNLEYRMTADGDVILTRVEQNGDHDLVIPETVEILGEQCKIVGFDNNLFVNNKDLWTISLPSTIEEMSNNKVFNAVVKGKGANASANSANYITTDLGTTLAAGEDWSISLTIEDNGNNFNQWGSALIATGNAPMNSTYGKGFQLYLQAGGGLVVKTDVDNDANKLTNLTKGTKFRIDIVYTHANTQLKVTATPLASVARNTPTSASLTVTQDMSDFTVVSHAIPEGVNITNLEVRKGVAPDPFQGCSNLFDITVAAGCDDYYVADRTLYRTGGVSLHTLADEAKEEDVRALGTLIDNTKTLMDIIATSVDATGKTTGLPLTTEQGKDFYVSTNADQNTGGGSSDGGGIAALVDNNEGTYFHTRWGGTAVNEPHYIQVDLGANNLMNYFKFTYKPRSGSPAPTAMTVYGSNDGINFTDVLATINTGLPAHNSGKTYESSPIDSKRYRYLRFIVTGSAGPGNAQYGGQYFFGMLEFDLFKLTSVVEVDTEYQELAGITNDEAAEVYDNLVNALYVYNNGGTAEELQAAYDALEPLYSAVNEEKNKMEYVRELNELIPATETLIKAIATSIEPVDKATEIALTTTEGQPNYIWCNAPTANEGVANLLDGQDGTILHTEWNAGTVGAYQHYLLVSVDAADLYNFSFRYKARTGNANNMNMGDIPSGIKVYGSNEKEGTYEELYTISGLTQSSGYDWTSPAIESVLSYRYLRFNVTANNGYWHMAEFDLFKLTSDIEVAPEYKTFGGITNEEAEAAYDCMVNAQALCSNGTAAELEAALNALQSKYDDLKAKKGKVLNGVYHIKHDDVNLFVAYAEANALTGLTGNGNAGFRLFDARVDNTWEGETSGDTNDNLKELQNNAIDAKVAADELFTIVPNSDATGYTISAQGLYMRTTGVYSQWCIQAFDTDIANAGVYLIEESNVAGLYKLKSNNANTQYVNDWGPVFGNDEWNKANLSTFSFTPVTEYAFSVTSAGMATLCLPFNVVLPEGMYAYDLAESKITKSGDVAYAYMDVIAEEGDILKKGTPVIVMAAEGEYDLAITMRNENAVSSLANSLLKGNFVSQTLTQGTDVKKFIFANGTQGVGFYIMDAKGTIGANKCWMEWAMPTDANVRSLAIRFGGGETTDIEEVEMEPARPVQQGIYNLAGQRLEVPQKGVNIINGKKVVIK